MGANASAEGGASGASEPHGHHGHHGHHRHHSEGRTGQTTRSHLLSLSKAHNKFSLQFYFEAAKDGKKAGNLAYGPLGISMGLGILYVGSKGVTLQELQEALCTTEVEQQHLLPAYAALHWDLIRSNVPKGCEFDAAIKLFVPNDFAILPAYTEVIKTYEISPLNHLDFECRPDLARKEINQWAEERSKGKIKDVVPPMGIVDRETCIFLLSAMHIKIQFLRPFDKKKTVDMPFYLPMKETLTVPMMHQQSLFQWAHSSKMDCDAIELPCTNTHMKLIILLPKKTEGIKKIEEKLTRGHLDTLLEAMTDHTVEVYLPRFTLEQSGLAGEVLHKCGVRALYGQGKADLSGIDGSRDLHLSRVFHYLHIEVDEGDPTDNPGPSTLPDGPGPCAAEEAPATASGGKAAKVKHFKVDRPFLFVLKDDRTGAIYALGRCVRPSNTPDSQTS